MPPRKCVRADGDEERPISAEAHSSPMGISMSTQLTAPRPQYATLPHRSHAFNGHTASTSTTTPSNFLASGSFTLTASSNFPSAAAPFTLPPPPIPALRNLPFSPTSEPNVPSEVEDELMEDLSSFPLSSINAAVLRFCRAEQGGTMFNMRCLSPSNDGEMNGRLWGRIICLMVSTSPSEGVPMREVIQALPRTCVLVVQPRLVTARVDFHHVAAKAIPPGACWSGAMSKLAKTAGVKGIVIDGGVCDLAWHREQNIPLFARYVSPDLTPQSRGAIVPYSTVYNDYGPAMITATIVKSHDFVVFGLDGNVVIPKDKLVNVHQEVVRMSKMPDFVNDEGVSSNLSHGSGSGVTIGTSS